MKEFNSVQYYLTDPTFREWIEKPTEELETYWQNWIQKHEGCEAAINEARELLLSMNFNEYRLSDVEKLAMLRNIEAATASASPAFKPKKYYDLSFFLKVAAVIAVFVVSIFLAEKITRELPPESLQVEHIVKSTTAGEKLTVKLQDGSMVKLNSQSKIVYPGQFNSMDERRIKLEGEAYFDVSKDTARAFIVDAGNISIRALGTAFSVSNYPGSDSICVSLTQGSVIVSDHDKSTELEAGQMACYNIAHARLVRYDWLDRELTGWIDDLIVFKNADWNEIENKLERWFGVEIVNKASGEVWDYSGEFRGSLDKILKSICYAKNLNYKIENDTVTIY